MTIADVIAYLEQNGQRLMAWLVKNQAEMLASARATNEFNCNEANRLRAKYEPMYRIGSARAPAESDG